MASYYAARSAHPSLFRRREQLLLLVELLESLLDFRDRLVLLLGDCELVLSECELVLGVDLVFRGDFYKQSPSGRGSETKSDFSTQPVSLTSHTTNHIDASLSFLFT